MKLHAILLGMAFAAGAAHAQAGEIGLIETGGVESDVGLGLFGSRDAEARLLAAWAELGKFGLERQHRLSANVMDADAMTPANPPEVRDAAPGITSPAGNGLWWRLKQFKFWHKDLFK